jgi:hypothetical protein
MYFTFAVLYVSYQSQPYKTEHGEAGEKEVIESPPV